MRSAALLSLLPLAMAAPVEDIRAPLHVPRGAIGNKYIVKMKPTVPNSFGIQSIKPEADREFPNLGTFAATLDEVDLENLRRNPQIEWIEKEGSMKVSAPVIQNGAQWGLARLSNTNRGSTTYTYDSTAGTGTCAYVIDTGVEESHSEFEGRAKLVANTIDNDSIDRHGHGTHVAGTIASKTYGVAKKAKIFAVKVFDATGESDNSIILAAIDFVLGDYQSRATECPKGFVVNMSLGGEVSEAIDNAVGRLVEAGLAVAVAAGNGDPLTGRAVNVDTVSPARNTAVCTVGATDTNDRIGVFSNYGTAVDILAPGVSVRSAVPGGSTGLKTGTSMATPHIAGLMAYYLGLDATTPVEACGYIGSTALQGKISGLQSSTVNKLAHIV